MRSDSHMAGMFQASRPFEMRIPRSRRSIRGTRHRTCPVRGVADMFPLSRVSGQLMHSTARSFRERRSGMLTGPCLAGMCQGSKGSDSWSCSSKHSILRQR